ncbi:MAG TPA: sigma-70 family RNA polymerase sigma factor, partial [Polyangiaceae bacterium]|nr:sigma-70 family RNA polymerase sigma factor [Polyangiaceae bacterium]
YDTHLSRYISLVHSYPQLTRENELALVERWLETRDEAARTAIVTAHLRYVVAIALKYRRYGVPVDELISEGNFGVVHALTKFEPGRGTRFVTYAAYWIRAYVLNHVIRSWSLVGVGSGALRSKMFFKLRRERVKILNLVGEGDTADAMLATALNLPQNKVVSMVRRLEARDVSLDSKVFDDSTATLADMLVAPGQSQEETVAGNEIGLQLKDAVRTAVATLDKRERYIVERRLMADGEEELSLAEIGRRLGVSRERARQLEARAKRKLKSRIEEISRDGGRWLELVTAA